MKLRKINKIEIKINREKSTKPKVFSLKRQIKLIASNQTTKVKKKRHKLLILELEEDNHYNSHKHFK